MQFSEGKSAKVNLRFTPSHLPGSPNRTHPEPHSVPVEQFLEMLRFEQREKLSELPIDLTRSGRDDFN